MGNKRKILLFDFDGVIVDSFRLSYESMKTITPNPPDEETYRNWFDGNIYDTAISSPNGDNTKIAADDPYFKLYTPLLMEQNPISDVVSVIKDLHASFRMAVVSGTISNPIKEYLGKHNLSNHFDVIYGGDVHKSKVAKIKMAFIEFGVTADDCVFITDTLGDMREAAKAGLESIGVSWGFQRHETLYKGNPLAIVDMPWQLVAVLQKAI